MGANNSVTKQTVKQEAINDIYQRTENTCIANTENVQSDVVVYIAPGASVGNITFDQRARTTASCVMNTNMEAITNTDFESIQFGSIEQHQPIFSFNNARIYQLSSQLIKNVMSQVITNTCQSNIRNIQRNILVYIATNARGGNLGFYQQADNDLDCNIFNSATLEAYIKASSRQRSEITQGIDIAGIIMMALILVAVIAGLFIVVKFVGAFTGGSKTTTTSNIVLQQPGQPSAIQADEMKINANAAEKIRLKPDASEQRIRLS